LESVLRPREQGPVAAQRLLMGDRSLQAKIASDLLLLGWYNFAAFKTRCNLKLTRFNPSSNIYERQQNSTWNDCFNLLHSPGRSRRSFLTAAFFRIICEM